MRRATLAFCLGLLTGCAASKVYVSSNYVASGKVALLPLSNESTDLDGPVFLRMLLYEGLTARGFQVLPSEETDAQLKAQGFTEGGQLRAATPQKIGQWTGADTLFFCTIEDFNYLNVGIYAQRRVKIAGELVSATTGERLWETEQESSTRAIATNKKEAERLFAAQLAIKAVEKATHVPLQAESRQAVYRLLNTLPRR